MHLCAVRRRAHRPRHRAVKVRGTVSQLCCHVLWQEQASHFAGLALLAHSRSGAPESNPESLAHCFHSSIRGQLGFRIWGRKLLRVSLTGWKIWAPITSPPMGSERLQVCRDSLGGDGKKTAELWERLEAWMAATTCMAVPRRERSWVMPAQTPSFNLLLQQRQGPWAERCQRKGRLGTWRPGGLGGVENLTLTVEVVAPRKNPTSI